MLIGEELEICHKLYVALCETGEYKIIEEVDHNF